MLQDTQALELDQVKELFAKWRSSRAALFGSVLRGEQCPDSDIDLLVDFEPGERWSLLQLSQAELELAAAIGRRVELVDRAVLIRSANPYRREAILNMAELFYGE